MTRVSVESYSGQGYADRPKAFHLRGNRHVVDSIIAEWSEPDGKGFRIMTEGFAIFDLFYDLTEDEWEIRPG